MKGTYLGEFEELVLLTIGILQEEAYGVAIKRELEKQTGRTISIGAVHASTNRLEEKGYLVSEFGETTKERGGKRKRYFKITALGKKALDYNIQTRVDLWNQIPDVAWEFKLC